MKCVVFYLALLLPWTALCAGSRIWTLQDGRTVEAGFVSLIGGEVSLKNEKGKLIRISADALSAEDRKYIQLEMPPRLDINFSKTTTQRIFPESHSDLPQSYYFEFETSIKRVSTKPYDYELVAEFFAIGDEIDGNKHILLDYQRRPFMLTDENNRSFSFSGNRVELVDYTVGAQRRGEKYGGFLVVVTDVRGEVIAYKASSEEYYENLDNLRNLPVGKYFDRTGTRVFPTPPKRFY